MAQVSKNLSEGFFSESKLQMPIYLTRQSTRKILKRRNINWKRQSNWLELRLCDHGAIFIHKGIAILLIYQTIMLILTELEVSHFKVLQQGGFKEVIS